jgi:RNA-directed DNA polymerase
LFQGSKDLPDNIDHSILLDLLRRRIDDERFIRLTAGMLKAGYMEDWTFHATFSGTPQGGVVSPILANVYLHELDEFLAGMKARFDRGKHRRVHIPFRNLSNDEHRHLIDQLLAQGRTAEAEAEKGKVRELQANALPYRPGTGSIRSSAGCPKFRRLPEVPPVALLPLRG